ncbi:hypothetical protein [Kutzneria sp. 744]|nr:hypothetical protein [Kutzneria sp. 744]
MSAARVRETTRGLSNLRFEAAGHIVFDLQKRFEDVVPVNDWDIEI